GTERRSQALRAVGTTDRSPDFHSEAQTAAATAGPTAPPRRVSLALSRSSEPRRDQLHSHPVDPPLTWGNSVIGSGEIRTIALIFTLSPFRTATRIAVGDAALRLGF